MSTLHITMIQSELHWEQVDANLQLFSEQMEPVSQTDIIVLPEMFTTGFSMRPELFSESPDGKAVQQMKAWASKKDAVVCGSLMTSDNKRYYNRFYWVEPDGTVQTYDKRHLFSLGHETQHYTAGKHQLTLTRNGFKIRCAICFDLRFPVWLRNNNSYDVLLIVANWPQRRIYAWRQLLIARAIENQCYVAALNRVGMDGNNIYHNGCSMFIGPKGEVLKEIRDENGLIDMVLSKSELDEVRNDFPFLTNADSFSINL